MQLITLYGGFHRVPSIKILISDAAAQALKAGETTLNDIVTTHQAQRLEKHFCGIKGCTCGNYRRAEIEFNNTKSK